ncbi:hypothetical protein L9F63_000292 [Diploptera punctata]|uniref:Uncharacterized protein n=1 Tax=Diploptera punctata TaxID=6984 RepID=A0AAD8ALZ3_DIPPU|nr:hypothetical protein L9F63_000292 [Diploptera punctata]
MKSSYSVINCEPVDMSSSCSDSQDSPTEREAANLLNKMDNAGYERDFRTTVEMRDVTPSSQPMNGNGVLGCTDTCLSLHQQTQKSLQQYQKTSGQKPENPWHRLKTIFLVSTIAILVVWIIVYTILSQLDVI